MGQYLNQRFIAQNLVTGRWLDWNVPLEITSPPRHDISGPGAMSAMINPEYDNLNGSEEIENLVWNPRAQLGALDAVSSLWLSSFCTTTNSDDFLYDGSRSFFVDITSAASIQSVRPVIGTGINEKIPCRPGETYNFQFWARAQQNSRIRAFIGVYSWNGSAWVLDTGSYGTQVIDATLAQGWHHLEHTFTVPNNAVGTHIQPFVVFTASGSNVTPAAITDFFYFSNAMLTQLAYTPDYVDGSKTNCTWDGAEHSSTSRRIGTGPLFTEWGTAIYVEVDGEIRWGGILVSSTFEDETWNLEFAGFTSYAADQPFMGEGFTGTGDEIGRYKPVGGVVDVFTVVRTLWNYLQGLPGGNINLQVDTHLSGFTVGRAPDPLDVDDDGDPYILNWYERQPIGAEIDSLAAEAPFDYWEEHKWIGTPDNPKIGHYLHLVYPRMGRHRSDLRFAQGENITSILTPQRLSDGVVTRVVGFGKGQGQSVVHTSVDVPSINTLRRVKVFSDNTIALKDRLLAKIIEKTPHTIDNVLFPEITVVDHPNAPIGSFRIGDDILVEGDVPWLGRVAVWHRILSTTFTPDGVSQLTLARSETPGANISPASAAQEIYNLEQRITGIERAEQLGKSSTQLGKVIVGTMATDEPRVEIRTESPANTSYPEPRVLFYTGDDEEDKPAIIGANANLFHGLKPTLVITSADAGFGRSVLNFYPEDDTNFGSWEFAPTNEVNNNNYNLNIYNDSNISLTSEDHPLTIGRPDGQHLRINKELIQASNGAVASGLLINYFGGIVYIGGDGAGGGASAVSIINTDAMTLASTTHALTLGLASVANLAFDRSSIQARNNGAAAQLNLNEFGGDVIIGTTSTALFVPGFVETAQARLTNTNDVSLSSTLHAFQIGPNSGENIRMDANEIMAVDNGGTATLFLQNSGGGIICPDMRIGFDEDTSSLTTSSTSYVLAGGAASVTVEVPPSLKLLITVSADIDNNGANNSRVSVNIAGAGFSDISASDAHAALGNGTIQRTHSVTHLFTLDGDGPAVITPRYRATAGTAGFDNTKITVVPVM